MYFEQAARRHPRPAEARRHGARQHRADREVHAELLLRPGRVSAEIPRRDDAANDDFLFDQGPAPRASARSSSTTTARPSTACDLPNVARLRASRSRSSASCSPATPPDRGADEGHRLPARRRRDLRARRLRPAHPRERPHLRRSTTTSSIRSSTSWCATCRSSRCSCYSQPSSTAKQMACCLRMIRKAVHDPARYERVWEEQVAPLSGAYEMRR